jgi:hypothetical protein
MSKVLDYKYSTEAIANFSQSELARQEKNDCVVRAVAAASGSAYEPAHQFVKSVFDRNDKEGTFGVGVMIEKIAGVAQKIGKSETTFEVMPEDKKVNYYKLHGQVIKRQKTVKSFIQDNTKGTFMVLVSKHAFVIKDGVLIDNRGEEFRPTRKVQDAFKVVASVETGQLSLF